MPTDVTPLVTRNAEHRAVHVDFASEVDAFAAARAEDAVASGSGHVFLGDLYLHRSNAEQRFFRHDGISDSLRLVTVAGFASIRGNLLPCIISSNHTDGLIRFEIHKRSRHLAV